MLLNGIEPIKALVLTLYYTLLLTRTFVLRSIILLGQNYNKAIKDKALGSNIAKGTTDPRVEFILQVLTQILIKFHLQNLE